MSILSLITQVLVYSDNTGSTDNPLQRDADWTRKYHNISLDSPDSDKKVLAPGESFTLCNGMRSPGLDGTSIMEINLISAADSLYRLSITAGAGEFRVPRILTSVDEVIVVINNNALAEFDFVGSTLTGVQVGDTMRINGALQFDNSPYKFNSLNSGIWIILSVSGTKISAVRHISEVFSGVNETVNNASSNVQIYSSDGIQTSDKLLISGSFSQTIWRTYTVSAVTPNTIDFVSSISIPDESSVSYVPDTLVFYENLKKFIYLEADQAAVIQFNNDISDNNVITPISAGDPSLPGFLSKFGDTYRCVIINKSVNPMNIKYISGE